MANYRIAYSCGHSEDAQLYGPMAQRERHIEAMGRHGQCSACRKADKLAAVQATESEHDLPALTGSDKQVSWARDIRAKMVSEAAEYVGKRVADAMEGKPRQTAEEHAAVALQGLYSQTTAKWWIDNRHSDGSILAADLFTAARKAWRDALLGRATAKGTEA